MYYNQKVNKGKLTTNREESYKKWIGTTIKKADGKNELMYDIIDITIYL